MPLLCIESATSVCSVAIVEDGKVIQLKETVDQANAHSELLTVFIDQILNDAGLKPKDLKAVAVSKGPGSFTGLRIGVSAAKGLCFALEIPLISIPTLKSLAAGYLLKSKVDASDLLCPVLDARRDEVYYAIYDSAMNEVVKTDFEILTPNSFAEFLSSKRMHFIGDGATKCKEFLNNTNGNFNSSFKASASHMATLATEKFERKGFEDLAYFEPFYLKDFVSGDGVRR